MQKLTYLKETTKKKKKPERFSNIDKIRTVDQQRIDYFRSKQIFNHNFIYIIKINNFRHMKNV